ncbi:MAG: twin-arginine translocase TatA/TatE family subunit [Magnetococcales bacterium]|nr:twin-arginine translocase TatA/TatE family subunit [Magnetococcales bacterium]
MGWVEIFVIAIVALLVIGPDKLPEVARGLAKGLRQVQRFVGEVRDTINLEEFDQQVRSEVDKTLNQNNKMKSNSDLSDLPHPDFVKYDQDIDVADDLYKPVPGSTTSAKKETDNQSI